MLIASVNNEKIKELTKLKDKKFRDKTNLFFVEGLDLVSEAYKSSLLKTLYIVEGYENPYDDIECVYVSPEVMKKISDLESPSQYFGICEKKAEKELGDKLIILDNIQDPGNLGTIIRSATAFEFNTVVIGSGSVDLYNPKVIRSTKGMIFNINIITRELDSFLDELTDYEIYGTDVISGEDIRKITIPSKMALIIGNEGNGISPNVKNKCDKFIYIRMNQNCESLNAGVSAAILMYEVMNK